MRRDGKFISVGCDVKFQILESGVSIPVCNEEDRRRNEAIAMYYVKHAACPKCGSTSNEQTCAGFAMFGRETDIDGNRVRCECGWKGIVHDLVPISFGGIGA